MKLKTIEVDGKTYAVISDGKPVYVDDDGKDIAFDAPGTRDTIKRLNGEAKSHRERAETAEGKLKTFEGITDPAAAIKAIATVKNLDDKKLVDAGEVEKIKVEVTKALEEKYAPVVKERDDLKSALNSEIIGGSFSRSKYITDKLVLKADPIQRIFGSNFTIENGNKIVGKDTAGNVIYSKARPGEIADFEEALEALVTAYPYKDDILKGSNGTGGGASSRTNSGGKDFTGLSPVERMNAARGIK